MRCEQAESSPTAPLQAALAAPIPTLSRRQWLTLAAWGGGGAALALGPGQARAQDGRPVRFILPVSAGSGVDTIVRAFGPQLAKALGQPVVIDNQPGAGGLTGSVALVKAPPDGLTLGVVSNNHVVFPSVYRKLNFDPIEDITPISVLGATPLALVVNPRRVSARNAAELIALLRAKPGDYNYASSGNGTILHLSAAMFLDEAGVQALHVPYKGVGPMLADLVGGQVDMGVLALNVIQGHLKSGALRAIGVGSPNRVPLMPELPTLMEQGLPHCQFEGWFAAIGPKGLPAAEVARVHNAFVAALGTAEVRDLMARQGNLIHPGSPEAAQAYFRSERDKYARLVKLTGVQLD
ncbi:MAG: tripartite tricarboxylate transporter substrate binding protein [Curvibacter sp.]|nr:tripartite tricarboxylate transporter substrate binding protein [Curvibacter sp.]